MAAKKKKTRKPGAASPDVTVKVDAQLKKAYDKLVAVIEASSRAEMLDFDRRWESAGAIVDHDPPLYVVGGHRNAAEFFRAVMREEPRTGWRYVRVAKFASPDDERSHGLAKLDAALGFIEAKLGKPLEHPPLPIALDRLRIPVGDHTKPLADASVAEILAATGALTSKSKKRPKTPARSAIEKTFAGVSSLSAVHVAERGGMVLREGRGWMLVYELRYVTV